ncbi:MAG: Fe-S cluster assembly ATPase SufC [Pseudomonadota bacterium]
MFEIKNLHAGIASKEVIKGLNLTVNPGEVHAIMGPNGSGKSTFSKVVAGHSDYEVSEGEVLLDIHFKMKNILLLTPDERARNGIFLAFQYPTEVPGVNNLEFLRASFNATMREQGIQEMDASSFEAFVLKKIEFLGMKPDFLARQVNVDFSGGEKKRNEVLQMAVLSPRLCILDEIDSGLDVDSLKAVADGVNRLRSKENAFILITHYQRLLDYIVPDKVHIFNDGRIIKSGGKELAKEVETLGYDHLIH